jgi:YegS/Rv2252/BmrU family lipid kinase
VGEDGIVFVVNPASANGATRKRWPEMARRAVAAGLDGATLESEGPGGVTELARRAAAEGARLVVVVGGDGTVHEAVNGLVGQSAELGVIPMGTGKDFVRTFGIPSKLERVFEILKNGRARAIDVGKVEFRAWDGSERAAYFANVASAGMSGAVAQRANATTKVLGGRASFLWATLAVFARWQNTEISVDVDGERREGPMLDVIVANCQYLGGGMRMCPEAVPDDGFFDVLLIGDITKRDLALTLPKVYRGTHLPHPKAEAFRCRTVTVDSPAPLPIELDGEQPGTTPVRFEVVPGALRLRVP